METTPLLGSKTERVKSPSRCRQAVMMLSCMMLQMLSVGVGYGLSVAYVEIVREYGSSRAETAVIQSVYMGILLAGGIVWTPLVDKIGPGIAALAGTSIAIIGLAISYFASSVIMYILMIGVLTGTGMSLTYFVTFVTVKWTFSENRGVALAMLTTGSSIGQCVMPYIYEILLEEFYLSGTFLILAGICANSFVFGLIIVFAKYHFPADDRKRTSTRSPFGYSKVFRNGLFMIVLFCIFLFTLTGPIESWFLVDLMVIRGFDRATGSLFVSLTGFINFFGRAGGGVLLYCCSLHELVHGAYLLVLVALSHALVLFMYDYWGLLFANLFYGIVFGASVSQGSSLILKLNEPEMYGQCLAVWNFVSGLGNLFGGLMGGFINDQTGSYDLLFLIAIACSLTFTVIYIGLYTYIRCTNWTYHKAEHKAIYTLMNDNNNEGDLEPLIKENGVAKQEPRVRRQQPRVRRLFDRETEFSHKTF